MIEDFFTEDFKTLLLKRKVHCKSDPSFFMSKVKEYRIAVKQSEKVPNFFYLTHEWTHEEAIYITKFFGKFQAYLNARQLHNVEESLHNVGII